MAFGSLPEAVAGDLPTESSGGFHVVFSRVSFLGVGILPVLLVLSGRLGKGSSLSAGGFLLLYRVAWSYLSGAVCGLFVGGAAGSFGRI